MRFDDAGRLISRKTVEGHQAGVTEVQVTQELLPGGSLVVRTRMLRYGEWEERGTVTYREESAARVLLPD